MRPWQSLFLTVLACCQVNAPHFVPGDGAQSLDASLDGPVPDAAHIDATAPDAIPVDAMPPVALTVTKTGSGQGVINWLTYTCGNGMSCNSMTTFVEPGTSVTLYPETLGGTGSYFAGFTGACSGVASPCTITVSAATSVTADFEPQPGNLVFVSSATYPANLGGVQAYDNMCNSLAGSAGINNPGQNAFVAFISDSTSLAKDRLGTARGFFRMDGLPFADDLSTLLVSSPKIFYPITEDELGVDPGPVPVFTATGYNGDLSSRDCQDWSTTSEDPNAPKGASGGETHGGPGAWTSLGPLYCATPERILCVEKTATVTAAPVPVAGKKIFITPTFTLGTTTPDAECDAAKPAGVGTVHAVIATSSVSAASRLVVDTTYVRPDGVRIGTGADLIAGNLASGFWQRGDGTYANVAYWTGSDAIDHVGVDTCSNWTSASSTATAPGGVGSLSQWWNYFAYPCSSMLAVLCVEE